MDGTKKMELPHDVVVENILSRLPVKSLHRFKTVCRSWEATISDPIFAGVHLRRSRSTSFNQDMFFWHEQQYDGDVDDRDLTKMNYQQQKLATKKFPLERKLDPSVLCYCDGLSLRRYPNTKDKMYVLHNLCSHTYIKFLCPYPIYHHTHTTLYGICYDPRINDYKVVIIDSNHYAVFHCRDQHWSEMKEITKDNFSRDEVIMGKGVSLNGNLYWILRTKQEEGNIIRFGMEIVGFDSTQEKFKKLPKPNYTRSENRLCMFLTCWEGHLCLLSNRYSNHYQMIKVVGDDDEEVSWTEFDGTPPLSDWARAYNAVLSPEDVTVLKVGDGWFTTMGYFRIPYLQNMFISSSSSNEKVWKRRSWKPLDLYKMLFPGRKQHN